MTIGTNLFARLTTEGFARTQSQISDLQGRIASGKSDPAPSADPIRALKLSAAGELRDRIDRYSANARAASDRLTQVDSVLADLSSMTAQLHELSLRAVDATMTDDAAAALRSEAVNLRAAMLVTANSRDASGQPLFSGYGKETPFVDGPMGIRFTGDAGRTSLPISEGFSVTTSLNGADVFGTGENGIFAAIDDLIAYLDPALNDGVTEIRAEGSARLSVPLARDAADLSFRLTGPKGEVDISVPLVAEAPGPLLDAINAKTSETGVSASLDTDGSSILLASIGEIRLSHGSKSDAPRGIILRMTSLSGTGDNSQPKILIGDRLDPNWLVTGFNDAVAKMAEKRGEIGALGRISDRQLARLEARSLNLELSTGQLEELDIAEAVTRLQTLLMTQQASQQTFVKIRTTGLFDYLR